MKGNLFMLGIIPSGTKTYNVISHIGSDNLIEGSIYVDNSDGRLYMYTTKYSRSNPSNGFFPIWNGVDKLVSQFSNEKYFDKDVLKFDICDIASTIDDDKASELIYKSKISDKRMILKSDINSEDNMFTQCIKGVLNKKEYTIVDLENMSSNIAVNQIETLFNALNRITFMRLDKWFIWVNDILHLSYIINLYHNDECVLEYKYPSDEFIIKNNNYDNIVSNGGDHFKKIIKIAMKMFNINKTDLRSDDIDDYTINNLITTIDSPTKPISAQIFGRFIRMAGMSYKISLFH